jgi:ABC-type dipeptide/oligopeptide/nickel transport system permease component
VKKYYIYIIIKNNHKMKKSLSILAFFGMAIYSFWFAFYGDIPVDNQIAMFFMGCLVVGAGIISLFQKGEAK